MVPLPLAGVPAFERRLVKTWWSHRARWTRRRDCLAIGLGLCGLRWAEVAAVLRKDLVPSDWVLAVRTVKRGVPRNISIGSSMGRGLELLWERRRPIGLSRRLGTAFYTRTGELLSHEAISRTLRAMTKEHFGRSFSFHCLRHTAAVRRYHATRDVLEVAKLLGHRNLQYTSTYLGTLLGCGEAGMPEFVTDRKSLLRIHDPDNKLGRTGT